MSEPRKVGAELRGHSYGLDTLAEIAEAEGWPEDSMGRLEAGMECLRDARKERNDCRAALASKELELAACEHNRIAGNESLLAERDAALARAERADAAVLELWDRTLFGQSEMPEIEALVAEIRARAEAPTEPKPTIDPLSIRPEYVDEAGYRYVMIDGKRAYLS